jgi:hypothetical protein
VHNVLINMEHHIQCMYPRRNWDSPNPSPASECALPTPRTEGWGAHSPAAKGVVEFQLRRLEKKLSTLPNLWASECVCGGGGGGIYTQ